MGTPSWLYYLFALAMLAVAAYAVSLLVLSVQNNDPAGRDIDVAHLFMGVAMAGMFVVRWAFWPSAFWELVFFVLMVWFIVRSSLSLQRYGFHIPHEAIHALMSFAMLLMFEYPMGAPSPSGAMAMSSSSHGILDPGIGLLLAFAFFGSAIFTLASPNKGASHHGTHVRRPCTRVYATVGGSEPIIAVERENAPEPLTGFAAALASPRLEDLSHVVMCVGMGFMLILML